MKHVPQETTFDDGRFDNSYENIVLTSPIEDYMYRRVGNAAVGVMFLVNYTHVPEDLPQDIMPPHLLGKMTVKVSRHTEGTSSFVSLN